MSAFEQVESHSVDTDKPQIDVATDVATPIKPEVNASAPARGAQQQCMVTPFQPLDDQKLADPHQCIHELNRQYAMVNVSGKALIVDTFADPPTYSSKQDFYDFLANQVITLNQVEIPLAHYWFKHKDRRQYLSGIVFDPSRQNTPGEYNLWKGWAVSPEATKSCQRFLWHLEHVICDGDPVCFHYFLDWLAKMVQEPQTLPGVAICLLSDQGTGKGLMMSYLHKIVGSHYKHISNKEQLLGRFTGQLEDALLVFADELHWEAKKGDTGILKTLITEKERMMENKHMKPYQVKNCIHLIIASNERWAIPAEMGDRRFFVLDVSAKKKGDHSYFARLSQEMNNGGPEALLHFLQQRDITGFNPSQFPKTAARVDQQLQSLEPLEQWLYHILSLGTHPLADTGSAALWPDRIIKALLYEHYRQWFKQHARVGQPETLGTFTKVLKNYGITPTKLPENEVGHRPQGYKLPDLTTIRQTFEDKLGHPVDWAEE